MVNRNDGFSGFLKSGSDLNVLNKGKIFFREKKGVEIVRYYFSIETPQRLMKYITQDNALVPCAICGNHLYKRVVNDKSNKLWSHNSFVKHKRHLVFVDSMGNTYKTCYKMNQCLKLGDFDIKSYELKHEFKVPNIDVFLGLEQGQKNKDDAFWKSLEEAYIKNVIPFFIKWGEKEINKRNVVQFNNDLLNVKKKFFIFYEDGPSQKTLLNKIFKIIGVKNE